MNQNIDLFKTQLCKSKEFILITGAGTSNDFNFPEWKKLKLKLAKFLPEKLKEELLVYDGTLDDFAESLYNEERDNELDQLKNKLAKLFCEIEKNCTSDLLFSDKSWLFHYSKTILEYNNIQKVTIATLNYDRTIEAFHDKHYYNTQKIENKNLSRSQIRDKNRLLKKEKRVEISKLHGSIYPFQNSQETKDYFSVSEQGEQNQNYSMTSSSPTEFGKYNNKQNERNKCRFQFVFESHPENIVYDSTNKSLLRSNNERTILISGISVIGLGSSKLKLPTREKIFITTNSDFNEIEKFKALNFIQLAKSNEEYLSLKDLFSSLE